MPKIGTVGYSENTKLKQYHFRNIVNKLLAIIQYIFAKHRRGGVVWHDFIFSYIDLTAGSGKINGNFGSPLILLDEIKQLNAHCEFTFVEKNKKTFDILRQNLMLTYPTMISDDIFCECDNIHKTLLFCGDLEINLHNMNYADYLPFARSDSTQQRYGLIYIDPNGMPSDFESIKKFYELKKNKQIDFMMHIPATARKRTRKSPLHQLNKSLAEELNEINKNFWIIREPYKSFQWTFLIGTNWDSFPTFQKLGFHRLSSIKGLSVFEKINFTAKELDERNFYDDYDEYLEHPIYRLIRKEAIAKAKWRCTNCNEHKAAEVHHLKYPEWGHFDVLENLMPICHECHRKKHKGIK